MNLFRYLRDNGLRQLPPPIEVEGEQEYDIEVIVGHSFFIDQPRFMGFFFGYDASEYMWLAKE